MTRAGGFACCSRWMTGTPCVPIGGMRRPGDSFYQITAKFIEPSLFFIIGVVWVMLIGSVSPDRYTLVGRVGDCDGYDMGDVSW